MIYLIDINRENLQLNFRPVAITPVPNSIIHPLLAPQSEAWKTKQNFSQPMGGRAMSETVHVHTNARNKTKLSHISIDATPQNTRIAEEEKHTSKVNTGYQLNNCHSIAPYFWGPKPHLSHHQVSKFVSVKGSSRHNCSINNERFEPSVAYQVEVC